jgi:hypothetical protein
MKITPPASRLEFVASARLAFDFVTEPPYSLWLESQDEGRVNYADAEVGLAITHGLLSYELDLAVWREAVPAEVTHPYGMPDLIRVADPDLARSYRAFAATTEAGVERGLTKLAADLRSYGRSALSGSAEFFTRMSQGRALAARETGSERQDKQIREQAGRAWRDRDFAKVVKEYSALADRMSPSERARLRYAHKQLDQECQE